MTFSKPFRTMLWILWLLGAGLAAHGIYQRMFHGHHAAAYGSYVVWGLWVSAYIYYIGLSAGSFLLSSLIYVFGFKQLQRIGKLSLFVAIVSLFMALVLILFDLGRMGRFWHVYASPNFGSMMAWMVWLYTAYFLLMCVEMWFALRPDLARWSAEAGMRGSIGKRLAFSAGPLTAEQEDAGQGWIKWLAAAGVPLAIAFHGGVGALFSTLSAREFWHTPLMPILFLTGALVSGTALMGFTVAAFWPTRDDIWRRTLHYIGRAVLGLLIFDVILEWAEFSVPMWYGVGREYGTLMQMLFGEYWWVFWVLHFGFGTVIPLILLITRGRRPWAVGLSGFLVASTFMAVRLNIVIPGLIEPHLQGLQNAFQDARLRFSYFPSFFEWEVSLAMVVLGTAIFYLGYRFLPLFEESKSSVAAGSKI
jgi:molybdopterin-containing oxidoreductase family membrane subunit